MNVLVKLALAWTVWSVVLSLVVGQALWALDRAPVRFADAHVH